MEAYTKRKRDEYDSISTATRRTLIELVFERDFPIRQASNQLGVKYSTGKTLVQQYRKTGQIDRVKNQRNIKTQMLQMPLSYNAMPQVNVSAFQESKQDEIPQRPDKVSFNRDSQSDGGRDLDCIMQVADGLKANQAFKLCNTQNQSGLHNGISFDFSAYAKPTEDHLQRGILSQSERKIRFEKNMININSFTKCLDELPVKPCSIQIDLHAFTAP